MTKEARETKEAGFDVAVGLLMAYAEAVGYKTEEPEECVRWELAKALYEEYKKGIEV